MEDFRELVAEQAKLELSLRFLTPQDHRTSACIEQIALLRIAMHREERYVDISEIDTGRQESPRHLPAAFSS